MRRKAHFGDCFQKWLLCAFRFLGGLILSGGPFAEYRGGSRECLLIPAFSTEIKRLRGWYG